MAESPQPTSPDELEALTVAELRERAQEAEIPGRSSMSKAELVEALADQTGGVSSRRAGLGGQPAYSRVEAFRDLAQARARGEMVFLPRYLTGHDRRRHVRQTIREDHQTRIASRDEEAAAKFDKLHESTYSFFRGTSLLFYRDLAGEDAAMPTVLALGDVHPGNYGVMPSADDVPIFGVNDFDEAFYAPFTWDLLRGATGFVLAAEEEGGEGRGKQRKIAAELVHGYVAEMELLTTEEGERHEQLRQDNAPKLIRELIDDALEDRAAWLGRKYHDEERGGFRSDDELAPVSDRVKEFQRAVDRYVRDNDLDVPKRAGKMRVKDVCRRFGQGTASLGLTRYYVMIEGPARDGSDDLILEFKQARRSSLAGLVPPSDFELEGNAERITHAQRVHLARGDRFYGAAELEGMSFTVRERSPYRDDMDLDDLSSKEWKKYAAICGRSLARSHARSDDAGLLDHDVEPDIVAAIGPPDLFVTDVVAYAEEAAARVRTDHQHFRADHDLGAFASVDRVFR